MRRVMKCSMVRLLSEAAFTSLVMDLSTVSAASLILMAIPS
jgi:hypothetical protein